MGVKAHSGELLVLNKVESRVVSAERQGVEEGEVSGEWG
jgi:hypothetical protein